MPRPALADPPAEAAAGASAGKAAAPGARADRRSAILLAAERLFAQHGYHSVTIRQIADEAGVPLALVGYYFGPKHDLFHAVFAHWNATIEQRLAALDAALADAHGPHRLQRIVEAFVRPVLRMRASAEGQYYARLVGRELGYSSQEADRVLREFFDPMAARFIDALQAALPGATPADAAWGYQFALGAMLHHLVDTRVERLSGGQARAFDPAASDQLVRFIVGGLRAAWPARARAARRVAAATHLTTPTPTRRHR